MMQQTVDRATYTTDVFQQMSDVSFKLLHSLLQTTHNTASSTMTIFIYYFDSTCTHTHPAFISPTNFSILTMVTAGPQMLPWGKLHRLLNQEFYKSDALSDSQNSQNTENCIFTLNLRCSTHQTTQRCNACILILQQMTDADISHD